MTHEFDAAARPKVRFAEEKAGRFVLGFIVLDHPRALNALDLAMLRAIGEKLIEWRAREEVACVVLHSDSERAFSAGGDVKTLAAALRRAHGLASAREYFTTEYFVDYLIHVYPKPILCWADGIAMGGGIGVMNGATCRIVTERSALAMPEVAIGLFPDVGATYFLHRIPDGLGLFLGLSGAAFSGYDAVAIGMAEGLVRADRKAALLSGLRDLAWSGDARRKSPSCGSAERRFKVSSGGRRSRRSTKRCGRRAATPGLSGRSAATLRPRRLPSRRRSNNCGGEKRSR